MPRCDSSETYMRAVWPEPSPAVLRLTFAAGISEVSRFSCMKFLSVPGVFERTTDARRQTCLHLKLATLRARLPDGSRVRREFHPRFCERPVVQFDRPTHPGRPSAKPVTSRPPQHSGAHGREVKVSPHPELLGIGIDEHTAMVVHFSSVPKPESTSSV
jgi:hypothetical protein